MDRETITVETPVDKHKVVIHKWLTGGEKRNITNALLEGAEFSQEQLDKPIVKGEMIKKMQDVTIDMIIVSINGSDKDKVKTLEDMRVPDFDFVMDKINEISNEGEKIVKK